MFDQAAVRQWLAILHGDAPGLIHICATGQWVGRCFGTDELDSAAGYVKHLDDQGREGIYVRMSTLRPDYVPDPEHRGSLPDTYALSALWADIDLSGPGHKTSGILPPDEESAMGVVSSSGLPDPSVWIHSGGGLYPVWLLDPPHRIDEDLTDVADLSANWQRVIGESAHRLGWFYGTGVGDLTRVLRIPGTVNRKAGLERPCLIVGGSGVRYPVEALYEAAADALAASVPEIPADPVRPPAATLDGYTSPGDAFAAGTDWGEILVPHGWHHVRRRGEVDYWCRPGKAGGISATTNAMGTDRLRVFTDASVFDACGYSKLAAYAVLEHGGDLSAAATQLRRRGYGDRPDAPAMQRKAIADLLGPPSMRPGSGPGAGASASPARTHAEPGAIDALDADLEVRLRYEREVEAQAHQLRVRREAARRVDAADHAATWREPPSRMSLTQELALPDDEVCWRIGRLLPAGANAVLTAQFKAGKTTLANNLVRALADGEDFLGRFEVTVPDGRIAVWNYEVSDGQYRRWLRDIGIVNTDRVSVLNLRGFRLPVIHPHVEDWICKWLEEHDIRVWVVDPFARAFVGAGEENSNSDVGVFLDTVDVIKERSGVGELILPTHTGRGEQEAGQERARGATRLDDWADVRWLLTTDEAGHRFFRAAGRDADVDEESLTYDPETRRLVFGGWDRRGVRRMALVDELVAFVAANPGLGVNEIVTGVGHRKVNVVAGLGEAVGRHRIIVDVAARGKRLHYAPGALRSTGVDG